MSEMQTIIAKKLKPHWICHFGFWDGPLDGLVEISNQYFYAKTKTRGHNRDYTLSHIVLTEECQRWLEDYQEAYPHTFYEDGVRPAYDGRPLAWFHEKWPENLITKLVKEPTQ